MAKNYKLPYIPDKNLYFAVTGACSYVRATGWFHKACSYYADKYDVDVKDIEKYVRIAQGNGQKKPNKANPRKYHYYAIEYSVMNGYDPYFEPLYAKYEVRRATSKQNAENAVSKEYFVYGDGGDLSYRDAYCGRVEEFDTKDAAEKRIKEWSDERRKDKENGYYQWPPTSIEVEQILKDLYKEDQQ